MNQDETRVYQSEEEMLAAITDAAKTAQFNGGEVGFMPLVKLTIEADKQFQIPPIDVCRSTLRGLSVDQRGQYFQILKEVDVTAGRLSEEDFIALKEEFPLRAQT
jgi:hypothetical protein